MKRSPIGIRGFFLGTVVALLLLPTLAGSSAWLIERANQQTEIRNRLNTAVAYLTSHGVDMQEPSAVQGFASLLGRLDLLAQVGIRGGPHGKGQLYISPSLQKQQVRLSGEAHERRRVPTATSGPRATLVADLYAAPASKTTRALVALTSGFVTLLAVLVAAMWIVGRWMVGPLTRLSTQVDKVGGGDLLIQVPRSRIGEIANIAEAVEGMASALGDSAQQQAEADEARRFLIASIAHDLRTPVFALRGHLQALTSQVGDPVIHLQRAEARASGLERLISNLFAYTREDYTQPAPQLEPVQIAELLHEITAELEHPVHLKGNTFELKGDDAIGVSIDRDRTKRALTNILDNAIRYSPRNNQIHLNWADLKNGTVEITIQDHGPGIDPDLLPHIFEPGIRGTHAAPSRDSGAGLGLTIAKRLLEHQAAAVTAQNLLTGGLEIRITFLGR